MARKAVVKRNYPKEKAALFIPFILLVVKMMTDNKYFPNPKVALDKLTEVALKLQDAFMERKDGKHARAVYKMALASAISLVDEQADYVSDVADGNPDIITSANFTPTKVTSSKSVTPQTPRAPTLENVNGELRITTETVDGASSYCWFVFIGDAFPIGITNSQLDIDPKTKMIILPAGSTRECVRGLPSFAKVTVQVLAQNVAGKSGLSTPVSIGVA